ncbi:MAG: hypothetical protein GY708_18545 [Actinomycetia bacterium]|nr:hypothetical protein [Actinomycetes bacterium]
MLVVVSDVVDDEAFGLSTVPDDGAIEQFASDRADPLFGERVRHLSLCRCVEDLEPFGSEDLVERVDGLASAISDQRPSALEVFGVADEQVGGGLGCPCACGVGGDAGEEDFAAVDLDEEPDVVAAQERGVDGEEVACDRGLGV